MATNIVSPSGTITAEDLSGYIERIERLEEEKANIAADITDVYSEAKGNGFDVKTMREIIKLRKLEAHEREEKEILLDLYLGALGMQPLPDGAISQEQTELFSSDEGD